MKLVHELVGALRVKIQLPTKRADGKDDFLYVVTTHLDVRIF